MNNIIEKFKQKRKAANARKWKHKEGGIIIAEKGIKAGQQAKQNLTKRKAPDWDNLDRGYRYLTQDMKLPHDQAIAIMGNVVEESQGNYKAVQKNGGGRGLIQWDGQPTPTGRYEQWGKIWASVAKPANVYDSKTDTMKNYWAPWGGLKGEQVRQKFINAPLKTKTKIYAESYLRPGKPRIKDRQLSAMQLDSIYNPRIKNIIIDKEGGIIKAQEGTKTTFGQKIQNILGNDTVKTIGSGLFNMLSNYNASSNYNNAIDNKIKALEKYKTYDDNLIQDWALQKAEEELKSQFDQQQQAFNSGMSFENPSSIVFEHKKRQLANSYAQKAKSQNDMEYQSKVANLESQKQDLTSEIFNGLINTGISAYANKALNPNGTPSKTTTNTTTTPNNNILKTGYEPYKSGYVDQFGNISTGMGGLQFDKNFNLVQKPLNYYNV